MAENNKIPIIVLNYKAKVLSYYESIKECIDMNGFSRTSVYRAFKHRKIHRCMLFIRETEYRQHWEAGTTHLLQFKTLKERNKETGLRLVKARVSLGSEEKRRKHISETMKAKHANGHPWNFEKSFHKKMKPVKCIETGIIYPSLNEASRQLGVNLSYVSRAVRSTWKVKGLTLRYAEECIIEKPSSQAT